MWIIERVTKLEEFTEMSDAIGCVTEARLGRVKIDKKRRRLNILGGQVRGIKIVSNCLVSKLGGRRSCFDFVACY